MRAGAVALALLALIGGASFASAAETLIPGKIFRDCETICPELVVIPQGGFVMGSDEKAESPRVPVTIAKPFALGRYETTFDEFDACVDAGGCAKKPFDRDWGRGQRPVHTVTLVEIEAYLNWLSKKTGRTYRLPSEAEWEYAARAGTTTARYWGGKSESDDAVASCGHANGADSTLLPLFAEAAGWAAAECRDGFAYTAPAGRFRPNAFGLHDMLGNVAEWTADCRNDTYRGAPADGRAWTAGNCYMRMVRGGGWDDGMTALRSAYRIASPVVVRVYTRGFRVARQE